MTTCVSGERVAVTIWKIATNAEYRTLAALFGLGRSTVGKIVIETCDAIATQLLSKYHSISTSDKFKETVDGFDTCLGFPHAAELLCKPQNISMACSWTYRCSCVCQLLYL